MNKYNRFFAPYSTDLLFNTRYLAKVGAWFFNMGYECGWGIYFYNSSMQLIHRPLAIHNEVCDGTIVTYEIMGRIYTLKGCAPPNVCQTKLLAGGGSSGQSPTNLILPKCPFHQLGWSSKGKMTLFFASSVVVNAFVVPRPSYPS